MKPVYQTIFDPHLGDCLRACIASIFEFSIDDMPNFWEQTQNVSKFWKLVDEWMSKNKGYRCISVQLEKKDRHLFDRILCIACAKSPRCKDEEHAVVWQDGTLHDPHPSGDGLAEKPDTFTIFIPIDPLRR